MAAMGDRPAYEDRLADLERELEIARGRQEAVAQVLAALARPKLRLQPVLDRIVAVATRLCQADSGFVYLAEGDRFHMRASVGQPEDVVEYERAHPDAAGLHSCTGRVALTRRPVHIRDVDADPDYGHPSRELYRPRTLLGLPVVVDDDLVGVIGLARYEVCPFDKDEIELTATFANQSAIAVANAKLFETVERQRSELARFLSPEVAELISSEGGAQLLAGHRAYITVVYFDLRGFTAFVETAEPEELISVVREYHAAAGELVRRHGGTVEHFAGDGLMVFFNDPVQVPSPELQAAGLACAMRKRVGELAAGWTKRGYELGIGAGIAVGYATLGRIGFEGRYDYGALGSVTNLAARLSDKAAPGQILLSQRAFGALEGRVDARPAGELRVKGFSRPVEAYELVAIADPGTEPVGHGNPGVDA
jgi:class 3 adenylate cyclase